MKQLPDNNIYLPVLILVAFSRHHCVYQAGLRHVGGCRSLKDAAAQPERERQQEWHSAHRAEAAIPILSHTNLFGPVAAA